MPMESSEMKFRRQPKPVTIQVIGGEQVDRIEMQLMIAQFLSHRWGNADLQHGPSIEYVHWHPNAVND